MGLLTEGQMTVLDKEFEAKRLRTLPGMAHFAGTGPKGKTCRECSEWFSDYADSYFAVNGKHHGILKPRPCTKYTAMMQGKAGPAIPYYAQACKYFDKVSTPPPIKHKGD
jgi:hypothetical protein